MHQMAARDLTRVTYRQFNASQRGRHRAALFPLLRFESFSADRAARRAVRARHTGRKSMKAKYLLAVGCSLAFPAAAATQNSVADFYKGKDIKIIVSSGAGGGYDAYARLVAKHLGKHIPGNPSIIVQNMPGAGGVVAANFIYNVAPKDGTVIGEVQRAVPFLQILGEKGPQFETDKFNWLGSLASEVTLCVSWHTSPVKTFEDLKKTELVVGGSGPNDTEQVPALLNNLLGTKFKIVSGYPSSTAVTLAVERGEV